MSIHDEYERSVGSKKRGLHPLAWIAIAFGSVALVGVATVTVAGLFVAREVREVIHEVREEPLKAAVRAINIHPEFQVVETDESAQTVLVRNVSTGAQSLVSADDAVDGGPGAAVLGVNQIRRDGAAASDARTPIPGRWAS